MDQNTAIYYYDSKPIFQKDIEDALKKAGLGKGDLVMVHSDLKTFGKIGNAVNKEHFLGLILNAFLNVLGKEGTLVVPTYTYSFCWKQIYDVKQSKSTVGTFTEFVRNQEMAVRSEDPIFSHAAIGKDAKKLMSNVSDVCFGENSFFDRLYKSNGKIINFGRFFDITFMHYIENNLKVPYRFDKKFSGTMIRTDGSKIHKEMTYFCNYYFSPGVEDEEQPVNPTCRILEKELEEKGLIKKIRLGSSEIVCSKARDCHDVACEMYQKDKFIFINGKFTKPDYEENIDKTDYVGLRMYYLMQTLFPITRSITGEGVRKTLKIIKEYIPIKIHEVPSGTKVFDWTVPKEWNIKDAYISDENGNKIIDFNKNNLHIVGYSVPVNKTVSLSELQDHLYSVPDQPEAIPYVTSFYEERWGFCITHRDREKLKDGKYKVYIDSELKDGSLTYGELIIPGKSDKEVFLSTYVCHPSMANNELSGPVVTTFLAKWLLSKPGKYTYRIIFIPETIGSISYLSKNLEVMKKNVIAGFNISCVGDNRAYSYIPTRSGNTYADKIALNILSFKHPDFTKWSFLNRESDERQYNAPGVDLPVCCVLRSKYRSYPEYHTSLDNLDFVNPHGLYGSYDVFKECLTLIEENRKYKLSCLCEPQLGKRGLYPSVSEKSSPKEVINMLDFIAYADGENDLIDISNKINVPVWELYPIIKKLMNADLLTV
jgi:aminopeptidase-like protein/aminoglycoside N3'-acetyltransferase